MTALQRFNPVTALHSLVVCTQSVCPVPSRMASDELLLQVADKLMTEFMDGEDAAAAFPIIRQWLDTLDAPEVQISSFST